MQIEPAMPPSLTVQQGAVEVTDQGADVARAVGLAVPLGFVLQAVNVRLLLLGPALRQRWSVWGV